MHGKKPRKECAHTFADAGRLHLQHGTHRRRAFIRGPFYTVGEETLGPVRAGCCAVRPAVTFFTLHERSSEDPTAEKIKS